MSLFLLTVTLTLKRIISGGIIGEGELCCVLGRARRSRGKALMMKGNQKVKLNRSKLKRGLAERTQSFKCVFLLPDILVELCYTNSKNIFLTIHYLHFMFFFLHWLLCNFLRLNVDLHCICLRSYTIIFAKK